MPKQKAMNNFLYKYSCWELGNYMCLCTYLLRKLSECVQGKHLSEEMYSAGFAAWVRLGI